jgi:C4-dicarboxylate-specific signal transduction histidine kinase
MFYEPTMWEQYSREIVVVIVILLVQTALIVMLIIERRRRRRAELEFRRSMVDLAQLNRSTALGELSASIAHELNQPLAAMLSNAEAADVLLRRDPPGLEEAEQALADIRHDSQRAGDIIRSMRSLFTKTDFAPEPVNLNEVVGEMLRFVSWEARSRGVTLNALLDGEIPEVMADRVQLDQVVLNLLTNAIEAAQSGAGAREVKVGTVWTGGAEIEIFVEDGGPGIAEDVIARIFEPHYTTKPQGMGMGLSISRNIIESHGSRLNVTNLSGGGARFWFTLKARTKA